MIDRVDFHSYRRPVRLRRHVDVAVDDIAVAVAVDSDSDVDVDSDVDSDVDVVHASLPM